MLRFFLVTIVAVATASIIHDGACPEMKPVENFNLTGYVGTWYEISKNPSEAEKNGKCSSAEYTLEGNVVKVKNAHVVNGVQAYIEGTAKLAADANKAAKLVISFKFDGKVVWGYKPQPTECKDCSDSKPHVIAEIVYDYVRESPLMVLKTDYSNYAIAYNCKYDEKTKKHEVNVWVLSRSKKLEGAAKTAVDDFFKANSKELDATKLVQTDFSEEACKFTSTSAITEIPKPSKS